MIDSIQAGMQAGMIGQPQAAPQSAAATGLFMGHAVQVQASPESILADAAEELGFAVDTTKDYAINQRKERESSEIGKKLLEQYQRIMQQVGKSDQMNALVDSLKRCANRHVMREQLQKQFSDPTDAWAALGYAIAAFENDPSVTREQIAELKQLAGAYEREHGQSIKLGLQGAIAGQGFPELGGADATRDLYRQTVGEFSSVNEVFADIKSQYGDNFDTAMDFLFAAISTDIASETPSMGKEHLESVHAKLGLVRLTQSAYKICDGTMTRWSDVHGVKGCELTSMGLLESIVGLRGNAYLGSFSIDQIAEKAAPPDIEHEVLFKQELLMAVRSFPVALFDDEQGRMTVMDAVQASVDDAIAREDEWLASQE
ncbi:MAG: type III secretion system gatekeeper subunit SctW [Duodenibacillus sp.]|nr:type III secretion system gatekeeper subunit SctW [Duodenibacillus sp.]